MAQERSEAPESLLPAIREDVRIGASLCRERIAQDHAHYRRNLRNRIAEAYLIATELRADFKLWQELLEDPFFNDDGEVRSLTEANFRPAVLQAVMYYLFNADLMDVTKRNRVWKYARAVEGYVEGDVPAEEVADRIKQDQGIEALCRKAAKDRPRQSPHQDWQERIRKDLPQLGPKPLRTVLLEVEEDEYEYLSSSESLDLHDARLRSMGNNEEGIPVLRIVKIEAL